MIDSNVEKHYTLAGDDRGFSIVELIVCIAILAIASVPLYQSMTLAVKTDAKAQSIQNATSLAESVMEEIKLTSIDDLKLRYTNVSSPLEDDGYFAKSATERITYLRTGLSLSGNSFITGNPGTEDLTVSPPKYKMPYYILYKHDEHAAQSNEKFDVVATIRTSTYMGAEGTDASDANTKKLPKIEEIDELTQAVISQKEITRFDDEALDYFKENIADYEHHAGDVKITEKKIIIDKMPTGDVDLPVKVRCRVVYKDNNSNTYSKDIFQSSFGYTEKVEGSSSSSSTTKMPLSSNIYIYYKRLLAVPIPGDPNPCNEFIEITDKAPGTHKVFLVMQTPTAITGTKVTVNNESEKVIDLTSNSQLDDNGNLYSADKKYELITNLNKSGSEGHIYNNEARIRIYDVNVTLYKGDEVYASIESTKEANDSK